MLKMEVTLIVAFALCILLFLCNFGIIGPVGNVLSGVMFGLFGLLAYVFPFVLFGFVFFVLRNSADMRGTLKNVAYCIAFVTVCMFFDLIGGISKTLEKYSIKDIFLFCRENKKGGGVIAGSIDFGLVKLIGVMGTVIVAIIVLILCIIAITEGAILGTVRESKDALKERVKEERGLKQQIYLEGREERERKRREREAQIRERREAARLEAEQKKQTEQFDQVNKKEIKEDEKILRTNKKVSGVTFDTEIVKRVSDEESGNMHEITLNGMDEKNAIYRSEPQKSNIEFKGFDEPSKPEEFIIETEDDPFIPEPIPQPKKEPTPRVQEKASDMSGNMPEVKPKEGSTTSTTTTIPKNPGPKHKYVFPPINLLTENKSRSGGDSREAVEQTAHKLEETLDIFGVKAHVVSVSQGPTVTRFELEPELGTKVSRIKGLTDDIKLSLATSDIRIEAPVPGKSVVGIEVPNKEAQSVLLRDLIDTPEFKNNKSSLTFAVGKDISGKVIVFDIDSFPHLLIAGATGSGKSVCINTIIMSIMYKAHPDEVKLIMIDPKVVELSVYNGIPHLLIDVVTDAKKAAGALNWAVTEMMERYKKFADMNVRDLKGYNEVMETKVKEGESPDIFAKLPRLVIIVDELADLMMVAKNEVEESICRLAQLARACGIHLVVATQRPSVDVITGLIKANMPSRIAFAVSSNVDSRTILDMGGAEELLGKGDMLFFPKGIKKPVRLQGAFVSDGDVNKVVDFLKGQDFSTDDSKADIESKIVSSAGSSSGSKSSGGGDVSDEDDLLLDAARFIIENDKASIGNLQRKFRIGFNRAARIMDTLAEWGVVSEEAGTKARTVLMTMTDLENYIEQNGL